MFNKWQAQRWWGENYDRIMELYNVQRFNQQALHTPPRSEDEVNHLKLYFMACLLGIDLFHWFLLLLQKNVQFVPNDNLVHYMIILLKSET